MKYYGKEKCRILKEIRAEIARANDIEWVVSECKHKGNCKGTCPKCEQEVRELEAALAKREALGKSVAVVGISASIALAVTGCVNPFPQPTDGVPAVDGELLPETTAETFEMIEGGLMPTPGEEIPLDTEIVVDGEILAGAPVEYPGDETEEETEEETETETYVLTGDMPE
jgi:hypothetical protein